MTLPDSLPPAGKEPGADMTMGASRPSGRFFTRSRLLAFAGIASVALGVARAGAPADQPEAEPGIPVTDKLTQQKCGGCHTADDKGNLSRISWVRTTPEGWAQAIHRMEKLNGLDISPEDERAVIRYLADSHGLAPEEAKPVMYLPEHRLVDETNIPSESVRGGCAACHAFAQPLSWRRSAKEWKMLQDFHVVLYSQADAQYRRPAADEPGAAIGQSTPIVQKPGGLPRTQGQVALDYMRRTAPLRTAEWTQWQAHAQPAKLGGTWLVNAMVPGKGRYFGTLTIAPTAASDGFTTSIALRSLADGSTMTRAGSGIVYAGYSWRGRSAPAGKPASPETLDNPTREVVWFSPDRKTAEGRWFWGEYQEFGWDVKLTRADGGPAIGAVYPASIKAGAKGVEVRILGDGLPTTLTAKDVDLGPGLTVTKIVSASGGEVVVRVDAATDARIGLRDVTVGPAVLAAALPVYHKIDYLKVTPETGLSRLGGAAHAKGYQQFDVVGFDNGPDGKPYTSDDVNVGSIAADWSTEEFQSVWYDDDKKYVGTISATGLFTPNLDGPNPERSGNRNNYGDVWVVAKAKSLTDGNGRPLTAKAHLVVTVPSFKRWDQPEVAQR